MAERAQHGGRRQGHRRSAAQHTGGVDPRQQAGGDIAGVALHAGDLPGKEQVLPAAGLQGRAQVGGRENEGVAVHLSIAGELRLLQPGDHPQNAPLLRESQVGLETHQVVERARQVILAQLHHRVRAASRAGVAQPHGAQRAVSQRVPSPAGENLHRQAALKKFVRPGFDAALQIQLETA